MTDEQVDIERVEGAGDTGAEGGPDAGEAWRDVVSSLESLGEAIAQWAKAAVNDPDNRAKAAELKSKLDAVGEKIGDTVSNAADSEAAEKVKDAAEKAGDAIKDFADKATTEVAPKVAGFFEDAAEKLRDAADRVGDDEDAAGADTDAGAADGGASGGADEGTDGGETS